MQNPSSSSRSDIEVYICNGSDADAFAEKLYKRLDTEGFIVWMTSMSNRWMNSSDNNLDVRVQSASTFIFIITPKLFSNQNRLFLFEQALQAQKTIIPVLFLPAEIELLPVELQDAQFIDFSQEDQFESSWDELVKAIGLHTSLSGRKEQKGIFSKPISTDTGPELFPLSVLDDFKISGSVQKAIDLAHNIAWKNSSTPIPLTTACVLFALTGNQSVGREDRFLREEFSKRGNLKQSDLVRRYLKAKASSRKEVFWREKATDTFDKVTVGVLNLMIDAQKFSFFTSNDTEIQLRHLVGALLRPLNTKNKTGAITQLEKIDFSINQLRESYFDFVKTNFADSGDNIEMWKELLLGIKSVVPEKETQFITSFSPDTSGDEDLLNIITDVNAIASLIAARKVSPPLSIGLFGDWGSGKSFFMRKLKQRVEWIAKQSSASLLPQSKISFYKNIIQIEFNAWHYSEGNLWASLVEHIFQNLRYSDEDKDNEVEERRNNLLNELSIGEEAKKKCEEAEKDAKADLLKKETAIIEIENQQRKEAGELGELTGKDLLKSVILSMELNSGIKQEIDAVLSNTGIKKIGDGVSELQSTLENGLMTFKRGYNILNPLLRAPDRRKRLVMLIVTLVGAPLLAVGVWALIYYYGEQQLSQFSLYATYAASALSGGALWIRKQLAWVSDGIDQIQSAKKLVELQISKELATKQSEHARVMAVHTQELELLKARHETLRQERSEAERKVEQIRREIQDTAATRRLAKFIQDRASSEDYRKHLGLLALIRRDFEKLSKLIDEENKNLEKAATIEQEEQEKKIRINRIVLYIDDLDRCKPEQVVAVLQAVHLLLAFPLFVVVVGVDARWVTRALRLSYPELLDEKIEQGQGAVPVTFGRTATAHDYLEKIFQIPFWLSPMEPPTTRAMLKALLRDTLEKNDTNTKPAPTKDINNPPSEQENTAVSSQPHDAANNDSINANMSNQSNVSYPPGPGNLNPLQENSAKPVSPKEPFELSPDTLKLYPVELRFMEELAPIIGRSPRAVKRFANVYRLLKAGQEGENRFSFSNPDDPNSTFRKAMFLLGIVIGLPSISTQVFQHLLDEFENRTIKCSILLTAVRKQLKSETDLEDLRRLELWLNEYQKGKWNDLPIESFCRLASTIARFSFNVERA